MNNDPRGTIVQQGNIMRIDNAFVEEVRCNYDSSGFIIVSYSVPEVNQMFSIQNLRLNISRNTAILNSLGQRIGLCQIRAGMWLNAVFSSRMTRSIPPQANAFLITVRRNLQPPQPPRPPFPPQPPRPPFSPQRPQLSSVTTGRIVMIDFDNNILVTAAPNNINNQTRFIITNATAFTNRFGAPIRFSALQPGQMVRVTHANFQTASIPPQTTAFNVQQL